MQNRKKPFDTLLLNKKLPCLMSLLLLIAAFLLPYIATRQSSRSDDAACVQSELPTAPGSASDSRQLIAPESVSGSELPTAPDADASGSTSSDSVTIVLDPGHGGMDPGMTGPDGSSERVLNLIYAKKLQKLLTSAGYRVVLTRETEDGLYDADAPSKKAQDMQRRIAVIRDEQPLAAVSLHLNSYQNPSVSGPQVFFFEGSSSGEALAASIQESLNTSLAISRPRMQKPNSGYYILKRSPVTTVIVECGFLSNPQEAQKLQEDAYQDQIVLAIFNGIDLWHTKARKTEQITSDNPTPDRSDSGRSLPAA